MSRIRIGAAMASGVAAGAIVLVFFLDGSLTPPAPRRPVVSTERGTPASASPAPWRAAREDCSTRSEAEFPDAFTSPLNLVVGPLVLVGGAYTDAVTVREFGGNKFPVLVKAGHTVAVRLPRRVRGLAGLAYGSLPQGETRLRDTYQSVTFVACRPGRPSRRYRPSGPSGSYADGVPVTFWSGFVLTREASCVPLDVYVDREPSPRRVGLSLGRRCGQ